MKHCVVTHDDSAVYDAECPARRTRLRGVCGGVALALVAFAYACAPYIDFAATHQPPAKPVALTETTRSDTFQLDGALFAAQPLGFAPRTFSQIAPLRSDLVATRAPVVRTVQSVPVPTPRPVDLGLQAQTPSMPAATQRSKTASAAAADPFEKLFGKPQKPATALAYAASDSGVRNDGTSLAPGALPANDGLTAIYDIAARTVYLPDGAKLEAHSGLGPRMDDPRFVHVKMHGATPPHVYDLTPREALFHGVEALRMTPVGGSEAIFGRAGLLTHTYLLGPNGDSNGCVSFKDYDAFLQAYKDGKVRRLVVVASIDDPQLDLRIAERRAPKPARRYAFSSFGATASQPTDDRYLSAFTSSLASRTSSSARSLN